MTEESSVTYWVKGPKHLWSCTIFKWRRDDKELVYGHLNKKYPTIKGYLVCLQKEVHVISLQADIMYNLN